MFNHEFLRPSWTPKPEPNSKVLIVGATGGIGKCLLDLLSPNEDCIIGAHGYTQVPNRNADNVFILQKKLNTEDACKSLVEDFYKMANGITSLVVLAGCINHNMHWKDLSEQQWNDEMTMNLNIPFFLARAAIKLMKSNNETSRIVLNGTESSLHGGSPTSFPYGISKRGTECMVQGLAREGANLGILVNGVRFGYITSGFHERWQGKTPGQLEERAEMVPLKRGGHPLEAAALITYLLSGWSRFITGQMIPLTGGDWL